jgi:hypothetical protein
MIIYAYYKSDEISQNEKERLLEILDMKTEDNELMKEAVNIIKKSGAI